MGTIMFQNTKEGIFWPLSDVLIGCLLVSMVGLLKQQKRVQAYGKDNHQTLPLQR